VESAGSFLLVCLLSAVAKAMADKFELPMLTFCKTTSVFYQNLNGCKGKSAVFSGKISVQRIGDRRQKTNLTTDLFHHEGTKG
jgi:hypothetical protein